MRKFIPALLLALFFTINPHTAQSSPFKLSTIKQYEDVPQIKDFKYWYGGPAYGFIVYLGSKDISGFETELQLHLSSKRLTKITFILGPAGIGEASCMADYKNVIKLMNQKYGHFQNQKIIKDPLMDDLISVSICVPIRNELYTVDTFWKLKDRVIVASLVGDDDGYYIEIEHIFSQSPPTPLKELKTIL